MPADGIEVALTFYPPGREITQYTTMPQVPGVGETLHWSLDGTVAGSRAWHVFAVSWVCENQSREVWRAEISLR